MNTIIKIIEVFFNDLALKQRKWLIKRCENRIKKLELKLLVERKYRELLLKDALKLCKDIQNTIDK